MTVTVQTSPKIAKGTVYIYRWTGHHWVKAGTAKTGTGGKAVKVLTLKKGSKASLKAIAASKTFVEHYSKVVKVTVKK